MKNITEYLNGLNTELELSYVYENNMSFNDFEDRVLTMIQETEVIYYSVAIDYLKDHDCSLHESIELAQELGVQVCDITSELLATLLKQSKLSEEFSELYVDIENYFNEYEEYLNEVNN